MDAPIALAKSKVRATVTIHAEVPERHPSAQVLGQERMGTGTILDREGHILTVNYIVMGAEHLNVVLLDGRTLPGRPLFRDFDSGIAIVKVRPGRYPTIPIGDPARVAAGQSAFIIASVGDDGRRISSGVVSAVEPFDAYWEYMLERAILFTAPNPGVGGGPLVNRAGQIVGVVSLNLNQILRMALAIPVDAYLRHADEVRRTGRIAARPARAWVGLYAQPGDEGILVAGVVPSGPADRSGLEEGDVILAVNDEQVANRPALYRVLWRHRAGDQVRLTVRRQSGVRSVPVDTQDRAEFYG